MRRHLERPLREAARTLTLAAVCLSGVGWASGLGGQEGTAVLRGVVFDSTRMEPLAGARVAVLGTAAITNADELGRFELTGIPTNAH